MITNHSKENLSWPCGRPSPHVYTSLIATSTSPLWVPCQHLYQTLADCSTQVRRFSVLERTIDFLSLQPPVFSRVLLAPFCTFSSTVDLIRLSQLSLFWRVLLASVCTFSSTVDLTRCVAHHVHTTFINDPKTTFISPLLGCSTQVRRFSVLERTVVFSQVAVQGESLLALRAAITPRVRLTHRHVDSTFIGALSPPLSDPPELLHAGSTFFSE